MRRVSWDLDTMIKSRRHLQLGPGDPVYGSGARLRRVGTDRVQQLINDLVATGRAGALTAATRSDD